MDVRLLRGIIITLLVVILVFSAIPMANSFLPMVHTRAGTFTLTASSSRSVSIDCDSGRVTIVQFSAEHNALEFFLVHSDFYDLAGLPDISQCQYHVISQSATYQFTVDRSGTWYLVFANSPQDQEVSYSWTDYSSEEWNTSQFINWTIILIGLLAVSSIFIIYVTKSRAARPVADKERMASRE